MAWGFALRALFIYSHTYNLHISPGSLTGKQEIICVKLSDIWDETRFAVEGLATYAGETLEPTIRLGVTGLSGAGKTVFITSLIHNLVSGGKLPLFDVVAEGRFKRAYLRPQPDDHVPRFDYERHIADILERRVWPESTRRISQLRLTIEFEPTGFWDRNVRGGKLNLDIVDYPGEWLLDLPLLNLTYAEWSEQTIDASRKGPRSQMAKPWQRLLDKADPAASADEALARDHAEQFTAYLLSCRNERLSLSALPPGRFLMPGDLEGSPALTFSPLNLEAGITYPRDSLAGMMERRFESYKSVVVKPFFRDHFARLDRQIILVDALAALNAGVDAVQDLETALADILKCFRTGANSWLSSILARRVDRILVAATKADHLHRDDHDQLEAVAKRLTEQAMERAELAGAHVEAVALSGIRATREARVNQDGEDLGLVTGTPVEGQKIGRKTFDGDKETAIFPGDLPGDPECLFDFSASKSSQNPLRFVRFRPPKPTSGPGGRPILPHIRLDRAINFLIGDRLQ